MSITSTTTRFLAGISAAIGITALSTFGSAASQKFYPDDPVWVERDAADASGMKPLETNLTVDFLYNFIVGQQDIAHSRAQNVNTVDEVPDSSWFTNRAGYRPLTSEEVAKGPDTTSGPAAGTWTVTSSKSDGVTPGFTIKDANGQRWFLKFDPPGYRGMATGTEVAVTKLMWALGYNVPENHIAYMRRDQLVIAKEAKFTPIGAKPRAMKATDLDNLLERADRERDGSYRIVASKALEGQFIGRVRFEGTRPDDPNDLIPHEHRRELRGYGVFAAWLNHSDAKAINSLDTLVKENGRAFVRHHIIDFGSSLGSAGIEPAHYYSGSQYLVEPGAIGKQLVGFGFAYPAWHTTKFHESRTIGRLPESNVRFDPEFWKSRVPNQAFLHAREDDKFWAARKLAAMTTDLLRAAVQAGQFNDPEAEAFLVRALAERRDAILRAYLPLVNPIADPILHTDGVLTFTNAAVDADVARRPHEYRAVWSTFDNITGDTRRVGETTAQDTRLQAPSNLPAISGVFVKVELAAKGAYTSWAAPVHAYFRYTDGNWQLVGFERQSGM